MKPGVQAVEDCTLLTKYPLVEGSINFFGEDLSHALDLDDMSQENKLDFWRHIINNKLTLGTDDQQQAHELLQSLSGEVVTWESKIHGMAAYAQPVKQNVLQVLTTLHTSTNHLSLLFDRARQFLLPKPLVAAELQNGRLLSLLETQESASYDIQVACLQSAFLLTPTVNDYKVEQDESVDHMQILGRFFYPQIPEDDLNNSRYLYYKDSGFEVLGVYWPKDELDCANPASYKVAAHVLGFGDIGMSSYTDEHLLVLNAECSHRAVTSFIASPDVTKVYVAGSIPQIIYNKAEPVRSTMLNAIKARELNGNQVGELLTVCHEQEGVALNLAELEGGGGSSI